MIFKVATPAILIFLSCCCTSPQPKAPQSGLLRILEDTTNNRRAKWDLDQIKHYTNICKAIGIRPLYDGVDSFEVRIWRQFSIYGMATNEEIYSLSVFDTTVMLTFYRVYCKQETYENEGYKYWNPFTEPVIDSFFATSKSFPVKIANNLDLQKIWGLKTQSAL